MLSSGCIEASEGVASVTGATSTAAREGKVNAGVGSGGLIGAGAA
jgi:hypothetical protein